MKNYWAFWKYSSFPYFLGGRITRMLDNGKIETLEYGHGTCFNPVKILPDNAGSKLQAELKKIAKERDRALKEFNKKWDEKVTKLIGKIEDLGPHGSARHRDACRIRAR